MVPLDKVLCFWGANQSKETPESARELDIRHRFGKPVRQKVTDYQIQNQGPTNTSRDS